VDLYRGSKSRSEMGGQTRMDGIELTPQFLLAPHERPLQSRTLLVRHLGTEKRDARPETGMQTRVADRACSAVTKRSSLIQNSYGAPHWLAVVVRKELRPLAHTLPCWQSRKGDKFHHLPS